MNRLTLGITGSAGLIGQALMTVALDRGHRVITLRHRETSTPAPRPHERMESRVFNERASSAELQGIDVLVHLAGENLMQAWTSKAMHRFWDSRVNSTEHLAHLLKTMDHPPKHIISASGIGYYGDRGEEELIESSAPGQGFLADLCQAWESPLQNLASSNIRTHQLRTSLVLGKQSTAWKLLKHAYQFHLGQQLGEAETWMSWIHLEDYIRLVFFLIDSESPSGPVNTSSPEPLRQKDFHHILETALGKSWLPQIPNKTLIQTLLPEQSQMFLNGTRVLPRKLLQEGFHFRYPTLKSAVESLLV